MTKGNLFVIPYSFFDILSSFWFLNSTFTSLPPLFLTLVL